MLRPMRMKLGATDLRLTVRTGVNRALTILREERAIASALRRMPTPVPWEWARPRLVPLLAGPMIDAEGESVVRTIMDPGVAVTFGIHLGRAFLLVDEAVTTRWECTVEQVQDAATANLRHWAARLEPTVVRTATMSGHRIRIIQDRPAWASSILLVSDELRRLLGNHDQILAAPRRDTLLSFSPNIPERIAGEIVVDFEIDAPYPLMLDPFVLEDGALSWVGSQEWDDSAA